MFALLIGVSLLVRPAGAKSVVECVDGSPCPVIAEQAVAPKKAHDCCLPQPCHEHEASIPKSQCVVKTTPPAEYISSRQAHFVPELPPLALHLPDPFAVVPSPQPVAIVTAPAEAPPWLLEADRGHGPRAPPSCR